MDEIALNPCLNFGTLVAEMLHAAEPGANLGIVAPMDHRLGRFKVAA